MNRNVMIVLAGGFLIAVLVAVLVQATLKGNKQEIAAAKEIPQVKVLVAAKNLEVGSDLSASDMRWQDWPESAVFPGAIEKEEGKKPEDMLSGRLRRSVVEGEPLMEAMIVPEEKGNFLAASLEAGMRAVAVEVNAAKMAGGFIGPGDYVDVLLTYKNKVKYAGDENPQIEDMIQLNIDSLATETVLQNIRVLAVDQVAKRKDDDKIKAGKTVTLQVDIGGAETLALAGEMGEISLALRKLGDTQIIEKKDQVKTDARLTNITDEIYEEMVKMQYNAGGVQKFVRIYNGATMQEVSVVGD